MKIINGFSEKIRTKVGKLILSATTVISVVLVIAFLVSGFEFSRLGVTFYKVTSIKVNGSVRVVMLSDVHLREYGEKNSKLISRIKTLDPDIIAVAGDLTIVDNPEHRPAIDLLNNLSDIAPVYYSYGNHEYTEILFNEDSKLGSELANTKAVVLNKNYETIEINGAKINVGGFCVGPQDINYQHEKFLDEFCDLDGFNLLLCHHVECFESAMNDYPVDLALTGHAHGGQVILPKIGALYSPDQGLLPKLTSGLKNLCGSEVVISRGLGNSSIVPRYNNDPELVVIDICEY